MWSWIEDLCFSVVSPVFIRHTNERRSPLVNVLVLFSIKELRPPIAIACKLKLRP